jgi:hypothetical protein
VVVDFDSSYVMTCLNVFEVGLALQRRMVSFVEQKGDEWWVMVSLRGRPGRRVAAGGETVG